MQGHHLVTANTPIVRSTTKVFLQLELECELKSSLQQNKRNAGITYRKYPLFKEFLVAFNLIEAQRGFSGVCVCSTVSKLSFLRESLSVCWYQD